MKLLYLIALTLCSATMGYAQVTLTAATNNPVAGDVMIKHTSAPTQLQGDGGANVTWNFSTLTDDFQDTVKYIPCNPTPLCSYFPGSNLAATESSNRSTEAYTYYITDNNKFATLGAYQANIDTLTYVNGDILHYPFTYGSTFSERIAITEKSSPANAPTNTYGVRTVTCDGYGTLVLPTGTFTNVLRVHQTSIDTEYSVSTRYIQDEIYCWYTPGFHMPLLQLEATTDLAPMQTVAFITYSTPVTTAVSNVAATNNQLAIYPNPASSDLNIKFSTTQNSNINISLVDLLGRTAATITNTAYAPGNHQLTYNVSALPKGLYMVRIQNNEKISTQKLEVR